MSDILLLLQLQIDAQALWNKKQQQNSEICLDEFCMFSI